MATIRHQLMIRADKAAIFRAITTRQGLAAWWTKDCIAKPEVGYVNEFKFGDLIHNKMKVARLQPDRLVEWECIQSVREWIGTRIIFELREKEGLNFLSFEHSGLPEEGEFFASCNFNWARSLISLKDLCENGKGSPFDPALDMEEVKAVTSTLGG